MALLRFDPFRDWDRWSEHTWPTANRRVPGMPFDAFRREHDVVLYFDLPGVDPDSIEVTVDKDSLTVAAERPSVRTDGYEVLVAERPSGRFVRQLLLGEGIDAGAVKAEYDAGVLTLTIPRAESAKPRKIQVTAGTGPAIDVSAKESEQSGGHAA